MTVQPRVTLSGIICLVMLLSVACTKNPTEPEPEPEQEIVWGPWAGIYQGTIKFTKHSAPLGWGKSDATLKITGSDTLEIEFSATTYSGLLIGKTWLFENVTNDSLTSLSAEYLLNDVRNQISFSRSVFLVKGISGTLDEVRINPDSTTTLEWEGTFSVILQ